MYINLNSSMKKLYCTSILIILAADSATKAMEKRCTNSGSNSSLGSGEIELFCSGSCSEGTSVRLSDGRRLSCNVDHKNDPPPWVPESETAPSVKSFDAGCHFIWDETVGERPVLDLIWTYKEHEILDGISNGFYISILNGLHGLHALLKIEGKKGKETESRLIKFRYNCYGSGGQFLGDFGFPLEIYALPASETNCLYRKFKKKLFSKCADTAPIPMTNAIATPGNTRRTTNGTQSAEEVAPEKSQWAIMIFGICLVVVVVALVGLLFYIRRRTSGKKSPDNGENPTPTKCLMLAGKTNDLFSTHKMILALREEIENTLGIEMEITSDWEHSKEIMLQGSNWYQQEFDKAHVAVFINLAHVMQDDMQEGNGFKLPVEASVLEYFRSGINHGRTTIFLEDNIEQVPSKIKNICSIFRLKPEYTKEDDFVRQLVTTAQTRHHRVIQQNKTKRSEEAIDITVETNRDDVPPRNSGGDEDTAVWKPMQWNSFQDNCSDNSIERVSTQHEQSDIVTTERDCLLQQEARPKIRDKDL